MARLRNKPATRRRDAEIRKTRAYTRNKNAAELARVPRSQRGFNGTQQALGAAGEKRFSVRPTRTNVFASTD